MSKIVPIGSKLTGVRTSMLDEVPIKKPKVKVLSAECIGVRLIGRFTPEELARENASTPVESQPASNGKAAEQPAKRKAAKPLMYGSDAWLRWVVRQTTEAKKAEKRAHVQQLVQKFLAMTEDERTAAVAGRLITNVEGRTLSPCNTFLLLAQRPNVSLVGTFRQWKKQGRCVVKGEHGLLINAPRTGKRKETDEEYLYFRPVNVFDIGQTVELTSDVIDQQNGALTPTTIES